MERDKMRQVLGYRIQEIREAHGETQQQLADALGLDRQVVKTWETGTRHIKGVDLIKLADHYDCTIDFLVGRSDNPTRDVKIQEFANYTGLSQWSIEELHNCTINKERETYLEIINAILENEDFFHEMGWNITRAAESQTLWRMIQGNGITVHDPDYWNESNRILTIANIATGEYSAYNYAKVPDAQEMPVVLPAGMWFLTAEDAAEFLINRATEVFRDIITQHMERWNVYPDLDFAPGAYGETQVTINPDPDPQEGKHGKD